MSNIKGWRLVPEEPTPEMLSAMHTAQEMWPLSHCDNMSEIEESFNRPRYIAALATAPKPADCGRVFESRAVEELIKQAFRLMPEGHDLSGAVPNDIDSAIDFVRMAADSPKVIHIPPPPNSHSAHYTALMCSLIALCGAQGMDAEDALKHAIYVLRKEFIE